MPECKICNKTLPSSKLRLYNPYNGKYVSYVESLKLKGYKYNLCEACYQEVQNEVK